jgi:putative membrane protein
MESDAPAASTEPGVMKKIPLTVLTAVVWAGQSGAALAFPGSRYWNDHMMGWGGWWIGPVMMGLGVLLVVLVIVGLWRLFSGGGASRRAHVPDRALDILRERFARGEIDEEEYEARKKALGG